MQDYDKVIRVCITAKIPNYQTFLLLSHLLYKNETQWSLHGTFINMLTYFHDLFFLNIDGTLCTMPNSIWGNTNGVPLHDMRYKDPLTLFRVLLPCWYDFDSMQWYYDLIVNERIPRHQSNTTWWIVIFQIFAVHRVGIAAIYRVQCYKKHNPKILYLSTYCVLHACFNKGIAILEEPAHIIEYSSSTKIAIVAHNSGIINILTILHYPEV